MTKIVIKRLVWNEYNSNHIKTHGVTKTEIEKVVKKVFYHKQTYKKRYLVVGKAGKRIISIVVGRKMLNTYYVVSARDSSRSERKKLNAKENKK